MTAWLIEALAGRAGVFLIAAIRAGLSENGVFYADALLRESVALFQNVRVFVKGDKEHLAGGGNDFRNLLGGLSEPRFVAGGAPDSGHIEAVLTLLDPAGAESVKLTEAVKARQTALFGFSIDALGTVKPGTVAGKPAKIATKFTEIKSVDLIVKPGAGGQVIGLVEALEDRTMDGLSDTLIETIINAGTLPAPAKARLKKKFHGTAPSEVEVREAVKAARDDLAAMTGSGAVQMGDFARIEAGETRAEKSAAMLDAFFDKAHKDHKHARSFRECYRAITGDRNVSGRLGDCDLSLMRETLMGTTALRESLDSGSWANALGNSVTRRMIDLYRIDDIYRVWPRIARITNAVDFRTQERWRVGGYGDLPAVSQGAPYLALSSPTDEKATYAVTKRGGTEDITLEMIKNDDVSAIQQIPQNLAMAAKRTLSEFSFDFVKDNPAIYDSVTWFHATHGGNLGTSALDATSFAAARLVMMKQQEKSSNKRLGIPPRTLAVPLDLQETAFNLFQRATENDRKFIATITPDIIPVWYWTDTNDWALFASPDEAPALEIGFLDGNEEPELFVQDNPTVGSMFSNDKLTYKIRHIYGGAVVDFRPAFKAVVA